MDDVSICFQGMGLDVMDDLGLASENRQFSIWKSARKCIAPGTTCHKETMFEGSEIAVYPFETFQQFVMGKAHVSSFLDVLAAQ